MNLRRFMLALLALVLGAGAWGASDPKPAPVLELVSDVPLPGPAVRFDYQSIDTTANRLYIAHMNAGKVLAFDLRDRRVAGTVDDLSRVTGVWVVPELGKVFASVAGKHQVAVIDAHTLAVVARVGEIGFPDGIAYAPAVKKIYVSDESGGGELVIDGPTARVITVIPLGGEAGNTLYDPGSGHVWVAVQDRGEIVEIDPVKDQVVGRHALPGASSPHGLSLDPVHRLLFVANEDAATLLVVNLKRMAVVDTLSVGREPDVLAFDAARLRLYVASESGSVTVFSVRGDRLEEEGTLTMPHAHTVAVDPRTGLVYFPLQDVGGHPVLRIMRAAGD
jgi:DNA-binding beta-propeller fold protein YncE